MIYAQKQALIKAVEESLRLIAFSLPAIAIQVITGNAALTASYGGTILTILRGVDKYIHENPNIKLNGLTTF